MSALGGTSSPQGAAHPHHWGGAARPLHLTHTHTHARALKKQERRSVPCSTAHKQPCRDMGAPAAHLPSPAGRPPTRRRDAGRRRGPNVRAQRTQHDCLQQETAARRAGHRAGWLPSGRTVPSQGPHPAGCPCGASTYSTRTHRAQARAPQPLQERTHRPHRARSHWLHAAVPSAARTHEEQALDAAADMSAKEKRHRSGRAGDSQPACPAQDNPGATRAQSTVSPETLGSSGTPG